MMEPVETLRRLAELESPTGDAARIAHAGGAGAGSLQPDRRGVQSYPAAAALVDSTYTMSYANSRNLRGNGRAYG